jgi:hypothetical protein
MYEIKKADIIIDNSKIETFMCKLTKDKILRAYKVGILIIKKPMRSEDIS